MSVTEDESGDWATSELADWQTFIYNVDFEPSMYANDSTVLTTPANKGHEAMGYLTYIVDHYDTLPSIIAFIHPHKTSWHNEDIELNNVDALNLLNLTFVEQAGYVNLRCGLNPGCSDEPTMNSYVIPWVWTTFFEGTSTQDEPFPGAIADTCCAQFVVSRTAVLQRPREDYIHFREWLLMTRLDDITSGRVMEYLWHIIFGKEAFLCPKTDVCFCQNYGRCGD